MGVDPLERVLVVNADDFGMSHGVNRAVVEAFDQGVVTSCSLLTVCPGTDEALRLLAERPDIPFGVHLTLVSESSTRRWPAAAPEARSLHDGDGLLLAQTHREELLTRARIEEVEGEMRAQLAVVLNRGLQPTHLDWHCLADGGRDDITQHTIDLAVEFGLAARLWMPTGRRAAIGRGLPVVDNEFLDSFALDLNTKDEEYRARVQALLPGLTEWAVHPGSDDAASRADDANWQVRHSDLVALTHPLLRATIEAEGIRLTDHQVWAHTSEEAEADRGFLYSSTPRGGRDPSGPRALGVVAGVLPQPMSGAVAVEHHGVEAEGSEFDKAVLGSSQHGVGDASAAAVGVYGEPVEVGASRR